MLTPTLARDLIHRIPRCQMKTLGMVTWKCSDSLSVSEEHTHTVFGNKNVKDGKIVPTNDNDCNVSLKTMLMNEDVFKDVIAFEAWLTPHTRVL